MTYIRNTQSTSTYDLQDDPAIELEEEYFDDGSYEGEVEPLSAVEVKSRLNELLQAQQISKVEYDRLIGKLNHSVVYSPQKQQEILAIIDGEISSSKDSGGDSFAAAEDVTSRQISDLMAQIKDGQVKPIDGELSSEQCVKILKQAMKDEKSNQGSRAAEEFMQVLDAVGGIEAIDPKNLAASKLGEMPSSVDKDSIYFDESGATLNLKAPCDESEVFVDNASNVTLAPKNSSDEVKISEEGDYYVVKMGGDTFKINKDAKLNIVSDQVTGDVSNEGGNIKVGTSGSKNYLNPAKLKELSGLISASAQKVASERPLKHYDFDNDQAVKIIEAMAKAMGETNPKKRQEAWESAADILGHFSTQTEYVNEAGKAYVNDVAQLVFNVLYDKMGEEGLKYALKQGLIPESIATNLASQLLVVEAENTNFDWQNAGGGGPGWTHRTSADFLKKYGSTEANAPKDE